MVLSNFQKTTIITNHATYVVSGYIFKSYSSRNVAISELKLDVDDPNGYFEPFARFLSGFPAIFYSRHAQFYKDVALKLEIPSLCQLFTSESVFAMERANNFAKTDTVMVGLLVDFDYCLVAQSDGVVSERYFRPGPQDLD